MLTTLPLLFALAGAAPSSSPPPSDPTPSVMTLFRDAADPAGPGCAISVMRGGEPVFSRTWGMANLETRTPIQPDTVLEAGSVSKQVTAAAVAVLVADGRLALDDDIRRYLPEIRDYGAPITIRRLLTHTSGLRNWDDLVELAGAGRDSRNHTNAQVLAIVARQSALNFTPGTEYLYSNSNYVLAAIIVERVSGQTFDAFSRARLFEPAGMDRTRWRDNHNTIVPGRATAYTPGEDGVLRQDMPLEDVVGPGGLLTTVGDLQRWNALLSAPPSWASDWVGLLTNTRGALADGTPIAYGLGLEWTSVNGRVLIFHAGATAGYRAYLARVPADGLSVAVLCNAGALNTEDLGPALTALFMPAAPASVEVPVGLVRPAPADLAGLWRNRLTGALVKVTVDEAGVHFNGGGPFSPDGTGRLVNRAGTREATVTRDHQGRPTGLSLTRIGNAAVLLAPVSAWKPDAKILAAFTGQFVSVDAEAVWTVAVDVAAGGVLRTTGPDGETFLLDPIYQDAFSGRDAYWTFVFERDRSNRVIGWRAYKTRTRGVVFRRLAGG